MFYMPLADDSVLNFNLFPKTVYCKSETILFDELLVKN